MVWNFVIQLLIGIALNILAYLILPRPKREKPPATSDLPDPTCEAGRPIPVVFGTLTVTGGNIIGFADKRKRESEVDA